MIEKKPAGYEISAASKLEIEGLDLEECEFYSLQVPRGFDVQKLSVSA